MSKVFARNYLWLAVLLSAIEFFLGGISPCAAAIIPTGNVEPEGTWTTSTTGYVGKTSDGSLLVDAGSVLQSYRTYIGYNSGVSGTATVSGADSKWINSVSLFVGFNGTGTLRIEAGGQVSNSSGNLDNGAVRATDH